LYTRDETSRYTELMPDGKAREFMLQMEPKSVILKPSFGVNMQGSGYYEISGLAWSGLAACAASTFPPMAARAGRKRPSPVPCCPKRLTRFRLPWMWSGGPATLMSRTTDEKGVVQKTHADWVAQYAPRQNFHFSAIQAGRLPPTGKVSNIYV